VPDDPALLVGVGAEGFDRESTRAEDELTVNETQGRDLEHFTGGISAVYRNMARALKPGAPLVFTYHHNKIEAYQAIGVGILDAGLTCSASIPCPAEMGGSIHIHGTGSSIIDTVFVCRSTGATARSTLFDTPTGLVRLVSRDLNQLCAAGVSPTAGDIRCIVFGHVTRMAVWTLRTGWNPDRSIKDKLERFARQLSTFGNLANIIDRAGSCLGNSQRPKNRSTAVKQTEGAGHAISV